MSHDDVEPDAPFDLAAVAADDLLVEEIIAGRGDRDDALVDLLAGWREEIAGAPAPAALPAGRPSRRAKSVRVGAVLVGVGMLVTSGVGQAVADDPVAPLRFLVVKGVELGSGLGSPETPEPPRVVRGAGALAETALVPGRSPLDRGSVAERPPDKTTPGAPSSAPPRPVGARASVRPRTVSPAAPAPQRPKRSGKVAAAPAPQAPQAPHKDRGKARGESRHEDAKPGVTPDPTRPGRGGDDSGHDGRKPHHEADPPDRRLQVHPFAPDRKPVEQVDPQEDPQEERPGATTDPAPEEAPGAESAPKGEEAPVPPRPDKTDRSERTEPTPEAARS